ncbi:hypothetical protein BKK50_10320, partial [Rodentibacter rarus]
MGKGGGGGGHTPYEAPESNKSKQSVRIVEAVSEGGVKGLVDGMKSIYLDDTPVQNRDGSFNFSNLNWQGRKGLAVQDQLSHFDTSEREVNVGKEVKKSSPLTRTITDSNVARLRLHLGVSSLFKQNDQGDTHGSSVNFIITVGDRSYPFNITGKHSSQYLRQFDIDDLPAVPFLLKVERVEPDSTSQRLQNKTLWASYTEIIEGEYTYPHTALMGIEFDSEYFSSIPTRGYEIYGIECLVPSNYDPVKRTYSGDYWDGTFKPEWTDNPLWVLYDLMTNKRYGLGNRIEGFSINKWAFYTAAQYCDQLVPDGFGGKEPRFTCNVWINESRKAYDLINDICSCFRGLPVWNGSEFSVVLDRPADPVWTYTNANVIDGEFEYSSSANKDRHNSIQITYFDKFDSYKSAIELVQDDQDVAKNGLKQLKKAAFGCTSRGQAFRTGKWILETERLETEMVTFTVGREGLANIPGDIIRVADNYFAGTEIGGRIISIAGKIITVDREVTLTGAKQVFSYIDGKGKERHAKIAAVKKKQITLIDPPMGIIEQHPWTLSNESLTTKLYRCITVQEKDGKDQFIISAIQHEPQKEAIVDNGARFEPRETTLFNTPKVGDIQINIGPDGKVRTLAETSNGIGLITYDIFIYKEAKLYSSKLGRTTTELELDDLENGEYTVVIRAKNEKGQLLNEKAKSFTIDRPPAPTGVRATGGLGSITLEWDWVNEATATEIFSSETDDIKTAKRIAKVTAQLYTHEVGAKQVRYYWLRHTRGINVGPFHQQAGLRAESAVDIDAELALLNEKLSQNIINDVIDTALPARHLEPIQTVAGLDVNTFTGYNQVHNTADGKLYTWNGKAYSHKVSTNDLEGQITANQLDSDLMAQLDSTQNIANAANLSVQQLQGNLTQEVNRINQSIRKESANLTKKVQAEAKARGTAITQLQNTDRQQAQQITTLTTQAEQALTGLTEERNARIAGDNAESMERTALTARVTAAESGITQLQRSVANQTTALSEAGQHLSAKIDGLRVGGRNYLRSSLDFSGYWRFGKHANETGRVFTENNEIVIDSQTANYSAAMQIAKEGTRSHTANCSETLKDLPSAIYTVSFEAKASVNGAIRVLLRQQLLPSGTKDTYKYITIDSQDWKKYTIQLDYRQVTNLNYVQFEFTCYLVGAEIRLRKVKLERGTIATDWTPAPEDVEENIANVSADLVSYRQTQAATDSAQATQLNALTTRMTGAESNITKVEQSVITLNSSTATRLNQLTANLTKAQTDLTAKITAEQTARANGDKSLASRIDTVNASVNNAKAQITTVSQAVADVNGKLSA